MTIHVHEGTEKAVEEIAAYQFPARAPHPLDMPDTRRTHSGEKKENVKTWLHGTAIDDLDLMADRYNTSRSVIIRWFIDRGLYDFADEIKSLKAS